MAISKIINALEKEDENFNLKNFICNFLSSQLSHIPSQTVKIKTRNQIKQCDEDTLAMSFDISKECMLIIFPTGTQRDHLNIDCMTGALGVGFRIFSRDEFDEIQRKFSFDVGTVLHLRELLPNCFIDYSYFENKHEFALNTLATSAALQIILPDVLEILQTETEG